MTRSNREILSDPGPPLNLAEARLRMETWAQGLEVVAKDEFFDMDEWHKVNLGQSLGDCGTAGCAAGWIPNIFPGTCMMKRIHGQMYPSNQWEDWDDHVSMWFGITFTAADRITSPSEYAIHPITRFHAAARIREVAADAGSFSL